MHSEPIRLQKWLAEAGLCSRREGDKWIAAGRVMVNGEVVTQLGSKVSRKDQVLVDGRPVVPARESLVVLMLHKPPGVVCTRHDPENRRTVFDLLGSDSVKQVVQGRLISIGRLDYQSEGLILFTNDGELAHQLMHPSNQVPRTYRVRVHGRVDAPLLESLRGGVVLDDGPTGPLQLVLDHVPGANSWLTITLTEGRNRLVRRIFETVGMEVSRLIRIQYGPCSLGELPRGEWRALPATEVTRLIAPLKAAHTLLARQQTAIPAPAPARLPTPPDRPARRSSSLSAGRLRKPGTRAGETGYGRTKKR